MEWIKWIEWIAAIAGAVSVYLSAREKVASWPTAIVNVTLSAFIYYETGLYSDTGLQVVYLVLSIYGWYHWLHGGEQRTELHVSRATPRVWAVSAAVAIPFWIGLALFTSRLPGASFPWLDSGLTTLSLVAQWMMTRKIVENWILWIIADVVYVPLLIVKKLYPFAGLYAVFLVLAVLGLIEWRKSLARVGAAVAPHPAPTPA